MGICFVIHRFNTRSVDLFLFLVCFSTYFKTKHLLQQKRAVKAAKSNRLHSHGVEIHLQKIRSQRCHYLKLRLFYICYFWGVKCKRTKKITQRCISCQNKSVCQKLARSCKSENWPKN